MISTVNLKWSNLKTAGFPCYLDPTMLFTADSSSCWINTDYTFHEVCILSHTGMIEKLRIKSIMTLVSYLPIKSSYGYFSCGFKSPFSIISLLHKGILVASPVGKLTSVMNVNFCSSGTDWTAFLFQYFKWILPQPLTLLRVPYMMSCFL